MGGMRFGLKHLLAVMASYALLADAARRTSHVALVLDSVANPTGDAQRVGQQDAAILMAEVPLLILLIYWLVLRLMSFVAKRKTTYFS
jgi:hypothetical protein